MREIKFRAWDEHKKEMVLSPLIPLNCGLMELNELFKIKNWVWMQYTGLKDKNNKEIYEGDILVDYDMDMYKVVWLDEDAAFGADGINHKMNLMLFDTFCEQVIGNIYENPELIE